jgi:hypothetical protein
MNKALMLSILLMLPLYGCASTGSARPSADIKRPHTLLSDEIDRGSTRPQSTEERLDQAVLQLAQEIEATLVAREGRRVAVVPFSRIDGRVPELGFYLADRLTNQLFKSRSSLIVIDRFHLSAALAEMEMGYSGLQDVQSAQKLGKIIGADAVVTGSLVELESSFDIILRLLSTETLDVLATAEGRVDKTETTTRMWNTEVGDVPQSSTAARGTGTSSPGKSSGAGATGSGSIVFCEDFSAVSRGNIPDSWEGGAGMAVNAGKGGKLELKNFEVRGNMMISTPTIQFPANFDCELVFWWDYGYFTISLGGLNIYLRDTGDVTINKAFITGLGRLENNVHTLKIEKRGDAFSFSLDGSEINTSRYPNVILRAVSFTNRSNSLPAKRFGIQKVCVKAVK